MSYKITIEMSVEDMNDFDFHASMARSQIKHAIKQNPDKPVSGQRHEGMNSFHEITIVKENDDES